MIGRARNAVFVLVGGCSGTLAGATLPNVVRSITIHAIGLVTLLVGVSNVREFDSPLKVCRG
jgi:uncharacterized membrane protein YqgA involved in biofilm formation